MTWDDALASMAGHPHARRYRELCGDGADPETRDAYRELVVRLARGEPPARRAAPVVVPVSYGDPAPAGRPCCGG